MSLPLPLRCGLLLTHMYRPVLPCTAWQDLMTKLGDPAYNISMENHM